MNPNYQAWVEKLESGDLPQALAGLHRDGGFCCLGVGMETARLQDPSRFDWILTKQGNDTAYIANNVANNWGFPDRTCEWSHIGMPPDVFYEWIGKPHWSNTLITNYPEEEARRIIIEYTRIRDEELVWETYIVPNLLAKLNDARVSHRLIAKFLRAIADV